jgi:flagellar hook-associated protein 3 FlgL
MRVTNGMLSSRTLRDLQSNYAALARSQEKVSSGKQLNRPSDDPASVRTAVRVRDTINALDQHLRNLDAADRSTSIAETALESAGNMMQRIRELTVQASNGTLSATDRAAILQEVGQLGESLVGLANTRSGDDYVFSGQQTRTPAYASLAAAYGGDAAGITARVSPGVSVRVNVTGDAAFGPALAAVAQLETDLAAGGPPASGTLQAIDDGMDALLVARTAIGSIQNRLDDSRQFVEGSLDAATKLLSDLEDADMAEVISTYANRQTAYEAALAVNAKILRRSLVDEL